MGRNGKQDEAVFPANLSLAWCELIIRQLSAIGCDAFFISPGLRNAPIIKAIQNSENSKIFINIDERSSSYQALGYAKGCSTPVALVCTSGTALANYYPAIIEAYYSHQSIIILSADRPYEYSNLDVNQTINQKNFFGNYVCNSINLPLPSHQIAPSVLLKLIESNINHRGPVHINIPLDEPLDSIPIESKYLIEWQKAKGIPLKQSTEEIPTLHFENLDQTLLVIGALSYSSSISKLVNTFPGDVYIDITSSIKFQCNRKITSKLEGTYLQIIHIGERLLDKNYYNFLEKQSSIKIIICNQLTHKRDHFPHIDHKYQLSPDIFAELVMTSFSATSLTKKSITISTHDEYHLFAQELSHLLENDSNLYLANSLAIRVFNEIELPHKNINVFYNRAVSGIEGLIASSIGLCQATNKKTTLVIGDISFLHDCNSLAQIKKLPLTIIVANNGGGKIFEELPIAQDFELLTTITTKHNYNFYHLAKQFDLSYKLVNNVAALKNVYGTCKIIEVELNGTMENRS